MARLYQYVQWHLSEVKPNSDHLQNHLIQKGKICRIMAQGRGATPTEVRKWANEASDLIPEETQKQTTTIKLSFYLKNKHFSWVSLGQSRL